MATFLDSGEESSRTLNSYTNTATADDVSSLGT
jgi:hypothetical protein